MAAVYDTIGKRYTHKRGTDPRIRKAIATRFGNARNILNIGAGTGSYEPKNLDVIAVEPSTTMLQQRGPDCAPAVQAYAEHLPFPDNSFDLAMGILTLHHWSDWRQGLREAMRVARGNVLLLTWLGQRKKFWLTEYFPEIAASDGARFPLIEEYENVLGPVELIELPIPYDCQDGFLCSYWRRPEAYLDPEVRNSISTFSMINNLDEGVALLASDLKSGRWQERYSELLAMESFDHGYRLVHTCG